MEHQRWLSEPPATRRIWAGSLLGAGDHIGASRWGAGMEDPTLHRFCSVACLIHS